jgi:hypothetical protein
MKAVTILLHTITCCSCALAQCATYTPAQIAAAISSSSTASSALKATACTWGAAAQSESGGNTCAANSGNAGVLQLSNANIAKAGYTPAQYEALPLQSQVDIWATQNGNGNAGNGNASTLLSDAASGQSIGGTPITSGMAAACVQFGPVICKNDMTALAAGQPCGGAAPVNAKNGVDPQTWTQDGNGQSICSWGANIQNNIAKCTGAGCNPTYNNVTGGVAMPGASPASAPTVNSAPGLITVS